jgi:hypothetical protein
MTKQVSIILALVVLALVASTGFWYVSHTRIASMPTQAAPVVVPKPVITPAVPEGYALKQDVAKVKLSADWYWYDYEGIQIPLQKKYKSGMKKYTDGTQNDFTYPFTIAKTFLAAGYRLPPYFSVRIINTSDLTNNFSETNATSFNNCENKIFFSDKVFACNVTKVSTNAEVPKGNYSLLSWSLPIDSKKILLIEASADCIATCYYTPQDKNTFDTMVGYMVQSIQVQ